MISKKVIAIRDYYDAFYYKNNNGSYFFVLPSGLVQESYDCREAFAYSFKKDCVRIGWMRTGLNINKINEFFNKIHKLINLKEEIIFHRTNYKDAIILELPKFWLKDYATRQFFTLFLRASNYYKESLNDAINSYRLANGIKKVIDYFLKGNTNLSVDYRAISSCGGIVDYFSGEPESLIYKTLSGGKKDVKKAGQIKLQPLSFKA